MGLSVAIAGASGYAGGELLRLLAAHPDLSVDVVTASSNAGELVTSVHPHLPQFAGRVFEAVDAATWAAADVVFLALPHGQSAAIVAQLPDHQLIVDLGADFRLRDSVAWEPVLRRRARGHLDLRPARAARSPRSDRGQPAHCKPWLLRHRDHPRARTVARSGHRRSRRHRGGGGERHHRRGSRHEAAPDGQRRDGLDVAVQSRRHASTHARDRTKPVGRRRAARRRCRSRPCSHRCHGASWPPVPRRR